MGTSSMVHAELVDACRGSAGSFWLLFATLSELQPELSEPRDNKYRRALAKWPKPWSYGKQNQTLNKRASFLQGCRRPAPVSPRVSQPCQRLCFCMHVRRSIPRGLVCSTLCHCCWLFFLLPGVRRNIPLLLCRLYRQFCFFSYGKIRGNAWFW